MSKSRRYSIVGLCALLLIVLITWYFSRTAQVAVPPAIAHGYSKALKQAHNGEPGAARVLYQQLGRPDLSPERRAALHAELPNYPSPQALKLADKDLTSDSALVREAAIHSIVGLVPTGQRTLLLGPVLDDPEQSVRFAAANALLGLSPDTLGLYFGPLQQVLEEFVKKLKAQPETAEGWIQLARLYIHSALLPEAQNALEQAMRLQPDNLQAVVAQIRGYSTNRARPMSRASCWRGNWRRTLSRPTCNTPWACGCCTMVSAPMRCSGCLKRWSLSQTTRITATTWPPPCTPKRNWKLPSANSKRSFSATPPIARRGCCW